MKCFVCKKQILDESKMKHIEDGDFIHIECEEKYKKDKDKFFDNIHNDVWYNNWINEFDYQ